MSSASKSGAKKKPTAKKAAAKKTTAGGAKTTKSEAKKPAASASATKGTAAKAGAQESGDGKKTQRKGITIVSKKTRKRSSVSKPTPKFPPTSGRLLGPGSPIRKPLIPSGPAAPRADENPLAEASDRKKKSPFNKRELTKFRNMLRVKRAELMGDINQMEAEALLGTASDLNSQPAPISDQGTDNYDRSLSLDLAAADRRLIREIDDALARIDAGTFGLCERSGNPIGRERLEELPWARYSIEAARAMERTGLPG